MSNKILENNIDISEFSNMVVVTGMLGLICMFLSSTILVAFFIAVVIVGLEYMFSKKKIKKDNLNIYEFINIAAVVGMLGLIFIFLNPTILVAFFIAILAVGIGYKFFDKKKIQ
jgi:hypothetical protein